MIPLSKVSGSWPDPVKQEIQSLNLGQAEVGLPEEAVAQGLKKGRLAFDWGTVRSWIPSAPTTGVSRHDRLELEMPLKIIAPLFLARQRGANKARPQLKVEEDDEIPELFAGLRQTTPAREAVRPPASPEVPAKNTHAAPARPVVPEPVPQPSELTPQDLVNSAVKLEGVAGALVALPEGLLVAARFPQGLDAENPAAFLPQIFSQLGRCTRELRIGELQAFEFLADKVTWRVFQLSGIFFVAFSQPNASLPVSQLLSLATALRQPR
jgi:predicted regulator of Ras-like GTPase activity (Roadblock/LC7/MglB family)